MATLAEDVQALVTAVQENTQATSDANARVVADIASLKAMIAAGSPVDPAIITSLEGATSAISANTAAILAIDPASPTPPPPPGA